MIRILCSSCLALILLLPATPAQTQGSGPTQRWSFLAGRVGIELPADWIPTAEEASPSPFADKSANSICLSDPASRGFLALHHFEDRTGLDDASAMVRSLRATCETAGINLTHCGASRLGGRNFAIAEGQFERPGQNVAVVVAATGLAGRPLIMVFGASGPDRDAILFTGQMAMLSIKVREKGPAEGADRNGVRVWDGTAKTSPGLATVPPESIPDQALTMNRKSIPATGVALDVPAGLLPGYLLPGYVSPDGWTLLYVEHSVMPYKVAHAFLSQDVLLRKGQNLESAEDVVVDGRPGILAMLASQSTVGPMKWWVLLTGNEEKSVQVVGRYPQNQALAYKQSLRDAVMSMQWNLEAEVYSTANLDYSFAETEHFRTVCRMHERVVLAPNGVSLPIPRSGPLVVISRGSCPGVIVDHTAMATDLAEESFLIRDFERITDSERNIAGARVCEMIGTARRAGTQSEVAYYLGLVVWQGQYCLVQGVQDLYATVNLQHEFAEITASVRLRNAAN